MPDDVSRLVGIDGLVVTGLVERTEQLELEVELMLEAGCCRWCGRGSLKVKDRPVVRVRDLPVAGRVTWLLWRKRRFYCEACGRRFTARDRRLRSRSPPGGRGAQWPQPPGRRALPAIAVRTRTTGDPGRLDRPLRRLPPSDPQRAAVGANRGRPLPPRSWRQHGAGQHPPRAPTRTSDQATEGHPPLRSPRPLEPRALPNPPPTAQGVRAPDRARPPPALRAVRTRPHPRRGVGAKGDVPLDLPGSKPRRRRAAPRPVPDRRRTRSATPIRLIRPYGGVLVKG